MITPAKQKALACNMALSRSKAIMPTAVTQWMRAGLKATTGMALHTSTSSSSHCAQHSFTENMSNSSHKDEGFFLTLSSISSSRTALDDTVALYEEERLRGGNSGYNFAPIVELSYSMTSNDDHSDAHLLTLPPPHSLNEILTELSTNNTTTTSQRNRSHEVSPTSPSNHNDVFVFATESMVSYDDEIDSMMHLLSFEDREVDPIALCEDSAGSRREDWDGRHVQRDENGSPFREWRQSTFESSLLPSHLSKSDDYEVIESSSRASRHESFDFLRCDYLGRRIRTQEEQTDDADDDVQLTDDCTLSSAETALVSNRSTDAMMKRQRNERSTADMNSKVSEHISLACTSQSPVKRKRKAYSTARKQARISSSRWPATLRNHKFCLTNSKLQLSAVSEE